MDLDVPNSKNWLQEAIDDVKKEVDLWPEWKRSDYIRLEIKKLEENKNEISNNK